MKSLKLRWLQCGDEGEDKETAYVLCLRAEVGRRSQRSWGGFVRRVFEGNKELESGYASTRRLAKLEAMATALQMLRLEVRRTIYAIEQKRAVEQKERAAVVKGVE